MQTHFTTQDEVRARVAALNMKWSGALKRADNCIARGDADAWAVAQRRADAIRAEMDRVEALIPALPAR